MSAPLAILVDDDLQQAGEASSALEEAGFSLEFFDAVGPALDFIDQVDRVIDLFVLDRKLPAKRGETAVDELGDELFQVVSRRFPDARIIVFSGFTDFDHAQESMEGAGLLFDHGNVRLGRVTVLKKAQFDKFERHLSDLRSVLREFENVELICPTGTDARQKRVLRRVAFEYRASKLKARLLAGGLTGAPVWQCDVEQPSGSVATIVAKVGDAIPAPGGLQDLLPRASIARRVEIVRGLMGGAIVSVLQVAGAEPTSLMSLIGVSDVDAALATRSLSATLDALDRSTLASRPLRDLVEQFMSWDALTDAIERAGASAPPPGLWVSTVSVMSHTDLHAGNVLVCDGSPVLIDSDENCFSSVLRDPVVLLLSSWIHPHSPIVQSGWPTAQYMELTFGTSEFSKQSPSPAWYSEALAWVGARQSSDREFWAVVLAYSARQSRFKNVREDERLREVVASLIRLSTQRLLEA